MTRFAEPRFKREWALGQRRKESRFKGDQKRSLPLIEHGETSGLAAPIGAGNSHFKNVSFPQRSTDACCLRSSWSTARCCCPIPRAMVSVLAGGSRVARVGSLGHAASDSCD